jgi:hypothetical protein
MPTAPAATVGAFIKRARDLTLSLGHRCAAGYLRNRGFDFEHAYLVLFNRPPRVI